MDPVLIADLCRDNIQPGYISAIVMVKWPYSSARQEMALILAEPSLRLRRANGQVKVRFTGAGALTLAMADVAVGDRVQLNLQGAVAKSRSEPKQLQGGIAFELCYTEIMALWMLPNGDPILSLEPNVDTDLAPELQPGHVDFGHVSCLNI